MMYLFIKKHWLGIVIAIVIIALLFLGNIDAIKAIGTGWTPSIVVAVSSVFVAGCALGVTVWQGWQNDRHNRLTVKPLLALSTDKRMGDDGINSYKLSIMNCGVGPAVIKNFILRYEGEEISRNNYQDYREFMSKILKGYSNASIGSLSPDSALGVGDTKMLWTFKYDPQKDDISFAKELDVLIEYESIHKDKIYIFDAKEDDSLMPPVLSHEAERIAYIHAACFTKTYSWTAQDFVGMLDNPKALHAIHDFGFAFGRWLDETQAELHSIAVVPYEQSRGRGRAVLNDFIDKIKAKGGKSIFLEVAKDNAPALHLYEKAGFKKIGIRPAYYKTSDTPPVDAISMRLDITE